MLERAAGAYLDAVAPVPFAETMVHLPLLLLCRVDGKSPVEYITDEGVRAGIRRLARGLLAERPGDLKELSERL